MRRSDRSERRWDLVRAGAIVEFWAMAAAYHGERLRDPHARVLELDELLVSATVAVALIEGRTPREVIQDHLEWAPSDEDWPVIAARRRERAEAEMGSISGEGEP